MELKTELKKPYTSKQRLDFIVEQNHRNGYEIKETEDSLQAWGLDYNDRKSQELIARADELHTLLRNADFWGQKYLDGEYTEEEWKEKVAMRKAWREELRSIENNEVKE